CTCCCGRLFLLVCILSLSPASSTLFPYTTLFRSEGVPMASVAHAQPVTQKRPLAGYVLTALVALFLGFDTIIKVLALAPAVQGRSEEHTSELQSRRELVCRLLLEKKKATIRTGTI